MPVQKKPVSGKKKTMEPKKAFSKKTKRTIVFGNLKEQLKGKLTEKERALVRSSYDHLGNIAILEIPHELIRKEKIIAQTLLESNPQLETVCKKLGAHKGKFRYEPVKVIAGKRNLLATYRESGCTFQIHVGKVFFSPRLSAERLRIAQLIKPSETVGVFFAGVGPFAIVFAKHSRAKEITGIELNPHAVKDFEKNIQLNKVGDRVLAVKADVTKLGKEFHGKFDRIAMPMPHGGENFLEYVLPCLKETGIIHFYTFASVENPFEGPEKMVKEACKKAGRDCTVIGQRVVRSFSKETCQVVLDFESKANR